MQTGNEGRDVLSNEFVSTSSNQDSLSCSSGETIAKSENAQSAGEKQHATESAKSTPLGLGVGGLERKVSLLVIFAHGIWMNPIA